MQNPWIEIVKLDEEKPISKIWRKSFYQKYNSIIAKRKDVVPKSFFKQNIMISSIDEIPNRADTLSKLSERAYSSNIYDLRTPRVVTNLLRKSRNEVDYSKNWRTSRKVSLCALINSKDHILNHLLHRTQSQKAIKIQMGCLIRHMGTNQGQFLV